MSLYILLMIFFTLSSCRNGQSKIKLFIGSSLLFLIMGFKGDKVGSDTPNYIELFYRLNRMPSWIDSNSRFEKGYQIYNKVLGNMSDNHQILFIITALICIYCITYGISKNSKNWMYSLFLFIGFRFYYFFLSGLRQSIAVSIIFVSYIFLKRNKLLTCIFLIILATTFHFSAFIFIFALPLSKMSAKKYDILKSILSILLIYILFRPLLMFILSKLPIYYSGYLNTSYMSGNDITNISGIIIPLLFIVLGYFINYNKEMKLNYELADKINKNDDILIRNTYKDTEILFLIVSSGISLLATRASILDRFVQYYWIFSICIIPNMLFSIKSKNKRTIWFIIITLLVFIYNIAFLLYRPEWGSVYPYEFCF